MKIELKPHRWPCYAVWAATPLVLVASFTSPLWCEAFWVLGGWGAENAIVVTQFWLWPPIVILNIIAGVACAEMREGGSW